jgi:hypothetical protein
VSRSSTLRRAAGRSIWYDNRKDLGNQGLNDGADSAGAVALTGRATTSAAVLIDGWALVQSGPANARVRREPVGGVIKDRERDRVRRCSSEIARGGWSTAAATASIDLHDCYPRGGRLIT